MVSLYIWLSICTNNEFKPSASLENSTSAHGGFRENLRLKHRSSYVVKLCIDIHKNIAFSNGEIVMFYCKIC